MLQLATLFSQTYCLEIVNVLQDDVHSLCIVRLVGVIRFAGGGKVYEVYAGNFTSLPSMHSC